MELTDKQLQIINNHSKKVLVKAGAGTGKTMIIIERVLRIIDEDPSVNIEDIAIITFTNKATEEIQSRLKLALYKKWRLEPDEIKRMRFRRQLESLNLAKISTIHKFCQAILEETGPFHDEHISYSPAYQVSSSRLIDTVDETIEEWIENKAAEDISIEHMKIMPVHELKKFIIRLYTEIRSKGLSINKILDKTRESALLEQSTQIRQLKYELLELLEGIIKNHKKYKHSRIDVDDLLEYSAHILVCRPDLKKKLQKKYKHIIVDEFQDTSLYQSEIIKNICDETENAPHLFVVGDSKQSIYGFRGADLNAYAEIESWIQRKGEVLSLQTNWRSEPDVVYFVNSIFQNLKNTSKYEFKHESLKPSKDKDIIKLTNAHQWIYGGSNEHGNLIAKYLRDAINKGINPGEFAILVRKNHQLPLIEEGLKKQGISEYVILGSGDFYNQKEIVEMYKVLMSLLDPDNSILSSEACDTDYFNGDNGSFLKLTEEVFNHNLIYKLTPTQLLHFILNRTDVNSRFSTQKVANLNKLKEKSRNTFFNEHITLKDYTNWLQIMIFSEQDEALASDLGKDERDKVKVLTIHRAKGLEFPKVILPYLNESISRNVLHPEIIIDQYNMSLEFRYEKYGEEAWVESNGYQQFIEKMQFDIYSEELRVLYVALTRAEKKLILVGDKKNRDPNTFQGWILNK